MDPNSLFTNPNSLFTGNTTPIGLVGNGRATADIICNWRPEDYHVTNSITGAGSTLTLSNSNQQIMNQQVKVAVFKVTRNEDNIVKSSAFIDEFWIEKKPGTSIDFAVAKKIGDKYEANEIVIKEIYTVTL
jgi:hypothetical protein